MKIAGSSSRLRLVLLLLAIVTGAITYFAAAHLEGTAAYVAAAVSLMLFLVEIVLEVADSARSSDGNSSTP